MESLLSLRLTDPAVCAFLAFSLLQDGRSIYSWGWP